VVSVAVTPTSPLRRLTLVTVTEMVPVPPCVTVMGEFDEREKSPFEPRPKYGPKIDPLRGVSPKPTVSKPAPAKPASRTDTSRVWPRMFI